jgi:hypothetical protein
LIEAKYIQSGISSGTYCVKKYERAMVAIAEGKKTTLPLTRTRSFTKEKE